MPGVPSVPRLMGYMKLTPAEFKMLAETVHAGHEIYEITKSRAEFRIRFKWFSGNAYGSRAFVYCLRTCMVLTAAKIRKFEAQLPWPPRLRHK